MATLALIYQINQWNSLPLLPPGEVYCGTSRFIAFVLAVFGAPILCVLFGVLAGVIGAVVDLSLRRKLEHTNSEDSTCN